MVTIRKSKPNSAAGSANKRSRKNIDLAWRGGDDEHINSDEEVESDDGETPSYKDEDDESEEENLDVKKVRLARQYLDKLEEISDSSASDNDEDENDDKNNDAMSRRLQRERLKREGLFERPMADRLETIVTALHKGVVDYHKRPALTLLPSDVAMNAWVDAGYMSLLKGHDLTPTCISLQGSGEKAVSGSKDHSVILWDVENESRLGTLIPHWRKNTTNNSKNSSTKNSFRTKGQVLAVACSDDGRYAAVGRRDSTVTIFDIRSKNNNGVNQVKTFYGHKDAITCLSFRSQSNQLFSGSDDRCIRHYNLDEMIYMETLYGHQFGVTDVDCHHKERPISVSSDRTLRAWKLQEDTHLIFRGGSKIQAADCVSVLKDDWFVAGHQDGLLSLWVTDKKKAISSVVHAHGTDDNLGRSIVSVECLKGSDVVASGSNDGYLRLWKADTHEKSLKALTQIPLHGFINEISFGPKGKFCAVAVGQEHKNGRWKRIAKAKNRIAFIKLYQNDDFRDENATDDIKANEGDVEKEEDDDSSHESN